MYKANYDLTRVRALPFEILKKMFPKACYVVTGRSFVRMGGCREVQDDTDPDKTKMIPNGRRVEQAGRTFDNVQLAYEYAKRTFGDRSNYRVSVLIPEIDCPGER